MIPHGYGPRIARCNLHFEKLTLRQPISGSRGRRHVAWAKICAHALICAALGLISGCTQPESSEVVVYVALDREFSEPILNDFAQSTQVKVRAKYDVESTKTVGLATAITAEQARPRCDVFWNNEILHTLRLAEAGLCEAYLSPLAKDYPPEFQAPDGTWHGFAARARVLLVNTDLVPPDTLPRSIYDLADSRWRGRIGIAKPLFGTTASHAACLFAAWGEDRARTYFESLTANEVQILSGNKQVARSVASGALAFGLTDTDDAIIEVDAGHPVVIVYPDQGADQPGTLFLPNTLAIIRDCPHPQQARRLVDYLLAPGVEDRLAVGASAQIPLGSRATATARVETPRTIKAMQVDFAEAARVWSVARDWLRDNFAQ